MCREPAKLIVAPMGRGKTAASLTAARSLHDTFDVRRTLIIGPKLVAEQTWPDEINAWEHTRLLSSAVCSGGKAERIDAVRQDRDLTIVTRDHLKWLWEFHDRGDTWPYDMVIVDESSMFKAGKIRTDVAKWTRKNGTIGVSQGGNRTRFGVLSNVRYKINRLYELTGTPSPNGLEDLWGQIYLLDGGRRLGHTIGNFRKRWFDKKHTGYGWEPRDYAEREIMGRISDIMVSLPPIEGLIPEPVMVPVWVDLPAPALREYRQFERTLVSEIHDVEAVNRGVLTNKLLQFANGSMYREDRSIAPVHDVKLDALDELIEQAGGDSVLIFYSYQFDRDAILKRHPDAVVLNETPNAISLWNQGKIRKLLAHPASCAHGLNLQFGGHIAIWYGLTWSLELYQQANARLARPGQTEQVAIYKIMARNTADENVNVTLDRKGATQDLITESVRVRLLETA